MSPQFLAIECRLKTELTLQHGPITLADELHSMDNIILSASKVRMVSHRLKSSRTKIDPDHPPIDEANLGLWKWDAYSITTLLHA